MGSLQQIQAAAQSIIEICQKDLATKADKEKLLKLQGEIFTGIENLVECEICGTHPREIHLDAEGQGFVGYGDRGCVVEGHGSDNLPCRRRRRTDRDWFWIADGGTRCGP